MAFHQCFSNLDRIEGPALAHVVRHDPHQEAVFAARVVPQAAHEHPVRMGRLRDDPSRETAS